LQSIKVPLFDSRCSSLSSEVVTPRWLSEDLLSIENSLPVAGSTPVIQELQQTFKLSTEEVEEAEEYISCRPEMRQRIFSFLNADLKTRRNESKLSNLFERIQEEVDAATPNAMTPKLPAKLFLKENFLQIEEAGAEETLVTKFQLSREQAAQVTAWYSGRQRASDAGASTTRWALFDQFMVFVFGEAYKYPFQRNLLEWDAGVAMKHNREIENAISLRNELEERVVYDNLEALITQYCETHMPPRYKEDFETWLEEDEARWKVTKRASLEGAKEVIAELFGYENFFLQQGPREALLARSQNWNDPELPLAELNSQAEFPDPQRGLPIGVKQKLDDDGVVIRLHGPDLDLNTAELISKQIPDTLFLQNDQIWNTREGDFPPSEIATHRFLQLHAKHPLIEGTGCPNLVDFKGVTQSDDQRTFYYWQEAGAETLYNLIYDGRKTFEKSLKKWYINCKEEPYNGGKPNKNRYISERSPWTKIMVRWFIDILCAVKYMHLHGVAHRDLKVENVVLCAEGLTKFEIMKNPELFEAKLIDFGLAHRFGKFDKSDTMTDYLGTLSIKSPELYQSTWEEDATHNAFASDVWALGYMLYTMLAKTDVLQIASEGDPNWYFVTALSYPRNEDSKPLDLPEEEYTLRHKKMNKKGIKYNFTDNLVEMLHEIFQPESERITIDRIFQEYLEQDIEELRKQKKLTYLEPYFRTIFPDGH